MELRDKFIKLVKESSKSYTINELFHYTNSEGLLGIIKNGEFWATHHKFHTDETEIKYGIELLKSKMREYSENETDIRKKPVIQDFNDRVHNVSYESAFRSAGYTVTVIPNQGKGAAMARVEETRRLFSQMWFDTGKCQGGIEALGWYHEKIDDVREIGLGPAHDWASHSADAFGLMAIVHKPPVIENTEPLRFTGC